MGTIYDKAKSFSGVAETESLYERARKAATQAPPVVVAEAPRKSFFERTTENLGALFRGEVPLRDIVREVPSVTTKGAKAFADTFVPAITNFFKTTGGILGEGLAYATSRDVREQYGAGNLDVLPTITNTTQAKLAKATIAAGIETAVYRSFPNLAKTTLATRGGLGALQGVGFAIAEGMAHDKSAEEIVKSLPAYGVFGGTIGVISPYLLPLLKAELKVVPREIKETFRGLQREAQTGLPAGTRKVPVTSEGGTTRVPISTPNQRYETYLRSQGYEPYIPEGQLPVIQMGVKEVRPGIPVERLEPPKVFADTPNVPEYIPESGLPVIQMGQRTASELPVIQIGEKATKAPLPEGMRLVPEGQPAKPTTPAREPVRTFETGEDFQFVPEKPAREATPTTLAREPVITETGEKIIPETRTTRVSREQLPVGEGATRASRLEARMKGTLDDPNVQKRAEAEGMTTYQQMNKAEQISKATTYVEKNPDEAMAVLKGEKPAPEGLLHNSIALALEKSAEVGADANLAIKLASLRSTRAGQEISILTKAEPSNPVSAIEEIIKARTQRATKKKIDVSGETKKAVSEGSEMLKREQLKIAEAEKLLNDLQC